MNETCLNQEETNVFFNNVNQIEALSAENLLGIAPPHNVKLENTKNILNIL